ncbi:DUF2254 family protein [Levyella massiliensis]|uniref:DUF2254 family protein n=1 Tax=Levyella massiliensis TaxID=938289 RepID=UPI003EBF6073
MLSNIKLWFLNQKNLLRMSKFILITIILLLVTWISDHQNIGLKNYIPNQLMLSVSVSVDFLSNISGVFLTISIFCFTTIVTVLNKYSSSISPRMLQRFIDKTGVLRLYGIFVSGFFYSVLSILLLQDLDSDQNVVAGSFGIAYSIIAMLGFIIFSKQVIDNIKMSNVIEGVFNDCDKLIDEEVELRENAEHYKDDESVTEIPLVAQKTGYFFKVKTDEILKNLNTIKSELTITKRIGEYVVEGEALGNLKIIESKKLDDETKEELREEISQFLVINIFNNREEDYHKGIVNLTEIANMALSPGINDPNTAIVCIQKISSLLGKLLSTSKQFIVLEEDDNTKIIYQSYSVEDEMYLAFSQIISYSGGDPLVTKTVLEGIYMIYMMAGMSAKEAVKRYFDSSYSILTANFSSEIHLKRFEHIKKKIEEHTDLAEQSEIK